MTKASPQNHRESWMTVPDKKIVKDLKKSMQKFDEENIQKGVEATAAFLAWQAEMRKQPNSVGYVRVQQ